MKADQMTRRGVPAARDAGANALVPGTGATALVGGGTAGGALALVNAGGALVDGIVRVYEARQQTRRTKYVCRTLQHDATQRRKSTQAIAAASTAQVGSFCEALPALVPEAQVAGVQQLDLVGIARAAGEPWARGGGAFPAADLDELEP